VVKTTHPIHGRRLRNSLDRKLQRIQDALGDGLHPFAPLSFSSGTASKRGFASSSSLLFE